MTECTDGPKIASPLKKPKCLSCVTDIITGAFSESVRCLQLFRIPVFRGESPIASDLSLVGLQIYGTYSLF